MKANKYNFFYYNEHITKQSFEFGVPKNWESQVNELGEYSWGGFRAILKD